MKRREFFNLAAATAGGTMLGALTPAEIEAQQGLAGSQGATSPTPKMTFKTREAKVEIVFKAPGLSGNGMQCTDEGIWTIDNAGSRTDTPGRCKVYLSSYEGKLLRELSPEGTGPSGIGVDEDNRTIWIGSTYSREIIRADAKTGETIEKHFTPGAGVIYRRSTDIPARPDTYGAKARTDAGIPARGNAGAAGGRRGGGAGNVAAAQAARGANGQNSGQATADGLGVGRGGAISGNPGPPAPGTGAHGQQTQGGKLWMSVPPGRMIYRVDPKTWTVEHMFPTVGYRPHGIGIETPDAKFLWESDTNMGGFFKRDMMTGEIVDAIILPDGSPFPHGMSVWKGYIYWVDDIGNSIAPIARTKI
jgi:streptogramin lyase